ncbi:hypothetical protein [Neolewinella antarctica]|uniref:Uncharacterized protein n=1 Tax=Neolewinella antarctica TaxID=442734 RepID=A0ABX0X710_9BACT|nr:hypothetical protein [Neolewinella antarctica]NJC25000.1 hypothetical protein [Neolewinella antarctica]
MVIGDIFDAVKDGLGDLVDTVGGGAGEKSLAIIDDWLEIFPALAQYNLELTSFSLGLAISPSLNVELVGSHADWSEENIAERLARHQGERAITMVLTTIRTAYRLHKKTQAALREPLILKVIVKVPPVVRVVLGQPILED